MIRKREIEIVQRQNNILMKDLRENNPTIIPDSPVEYLRNGKNYSIQYFLPNTLICLNMI